MKPYILLAALLLSCRGPAPDVILSPDATPAPAAAAKSPAGPPPVADTNGTWSLHFSPNGGCETAIVAFIGSAKTSVHLLAYGFTEEPVAQALVAQKAAGRDVRVVLDKSDRTAKNTMAPVLKAGGVPVWIDAKHSIMHDKIVVVDGTSFETGSYNFTDSAEKHNAENCLIEQDPAKAGLYDQNFQVHLGHSEPF